MDVIEAYGETSRYSRIIRLVTRLPCRPGFMRLVEG